MDLPFPSSDVEDFLKICLPNGGLSNYDAVITSLHKKKMLTPRKQSSYQQPTSSNRRPTYTHALKAFKGLFQSGFATPSRVTASLRSIGDAVRNALRKVKGCKVNDFTIRPVEEEGRVVDTCITGNADAPLLSTDVVVPLRIITPQYSIASEEESPPELFSVLNDDPRRVFTYAITIEGVHISMWYFSRTFCVKSTPFDMTEHPDLLIKLLICILTATEVQLGYDALVTLLPDSSYVYELPPREGRGDRLFYRTVELISQHHSADPTKRSARIWKVEQVVSSTTPERLVGTTTTVLKDIFLGPSVRTEAEIQEQLFSDIAAFGKSENWQGCDLLKEMPQGDLDVLGEALKGDNFKRLFSRIVCDHVSYPSLLPVATEPRVEPKRRCFFIYEGLFTPLSNISTLGEAIDILKQSVTALRLMFCAGWVHRDMSVGNVLAFRPTADAPWQAKLSDLEFARRFPDPDIASDENPIGTPYFMAAEPQRLLHFYPLVAKRKKDRVEYPNRQVIQNYQHDLESVWWIILWLVTIRTGCGGSEQFDELYFRSTEGRAYGHARAHLLSAEQSLLRHANLPRSLPQPFYQDPSFLTCLDDLKINLHVEYCERNTAGRQDDRATYSWIIGEGMSDFFNDIEEFRQDWADMVLMVDARPERPPVNETVDGASEIRRPVAHKRLRPMADEGDGDAAEPHPPSRPRKKARIQDQDALPTIGPPVLRRAGPVTRSMTRGERYNRPTTRSVTRRLREVAAAQKERPGSARPKLTRLAKKARS